ncbi:hypothetical protein Fot_37866 [Forsythia ovata]|uniref:Uncharacterized protein n=1 Tax=Forsythia ovata TaxID=205694 RepID=A0ABD1S493_9LAMI
MGMSDKKKLIENLYGHIPIEQLGNVLAVCVVLAVCGRDNSHLYGGFDVGLFLFTVVVYSDAYIGFCFAYIVNLISTPSSRISLPFVCLARAFTVKHLLGSSSFSIQNEAGTLPNDSYATLLARVIGIIGLVDQDIYKYLHDLSTEAGGYEWVIGAFAAHPQIDEGPSRTHKSPANAQFGVLGLAIGILPKKVVQTKNVYRVPHSGNNPRE